VLINIFYEFGFYSIQITRDNNINLVQIFETQGLVKVNYQLFIIRWQCLILVINLIISYSMKEIEKVIRFKNKKLKKFLGKVFQHFIKYLIYNVYLFIAVL